MEKITIEHLAPYLPYGLQMKSLIDGGNVTVLRGNHLEGKFTRIFEVLQYKPILRPLSDLNEYADGVSLPRHVDVLNKDTGNVYIIDAELDFEIDVESFSYNFYFNMDLPIQVLKWLQKEKFDYMGLIEKGLAVDINTLKQ